MTHPTSSSVPRRDWPLYVLFLIDLAFAAWSFPRLPARVPTHWGVLGEPDAYGPAWVGAFGILGIVVLVYLLLALFAGPRVERQYGIPPRVTTTLRWGVTLFFLALHAMTLASALGMAVNVVLVVRVLIPLLFLVIAGTFRSTPPNPFIGIRLPWTLADHAVWRATHKLSAHVWAWGAVVMLLAAALPLPAGFYVFFAVLILMVLIPLVASWRFATRR